MQVFLLLLGHLAAAGYDVASVFWWVRYDVATFNKAPANDTFHQVFHRQRATWRTCITVAVLLLCALPAATWHWWHWVPVPHLGPGYWLNLAGMATFATGFWLRTFNPQLSKARHLDYVERFYISFSATAAWLPDRLLANWARRKYPTDEAQARAWAATKNHQFLNLILTGSIVAYAATLLHYFLVYVRN